MKLRTEHFAGPLFAFLTLAIGIGYVVAISYLSTLFSQTETPVVQASPDERAKPQELSCYDLTLLPIWHELKRDDQFRSVVALIPSRTDCSDLLEVTRIDLNRDGSKEFLVWGKDRFCGATANCSFWVFEIRKGRVAKLLASGGIRYEVQKSKKNGFHNLVLRFNGSSYPDSLLEYRFNGREYRLARCYSQDKQTLEKWDESCEGW